MGVVLAISAAVMIGIGIISLACCVSAGRADEQAEAMKHDERIEQRRVA